MSEESLAIANKALALQIEANKKYAEELLIVNKQLIFQNEEREKRAAELVIANKELAFQNTEKEKRAAELVIANTKLIFENNEKEKRATELIIANKELAFQNVEKEKRAAELVVANKELAFQNSEKEKRAAELLIVNKELKSFIFISSHDLQEPLRKIRIFSSRILDNEYLNLSESGMNYFNRLQKSSLYMQMLINDLLAFSRTTISERIFENKDLNKMVEEVAFDFKDEIDLKSAEIKCINLSNAYIIPFQFKQLIHNLIGNALKFYRPNTKPIITISSTTFISKKEVHEDLIPEKKYLHLSIHDNGIGFEPVYKTKIFEIFQRLNDKNLYKGTGIGLTIAKKIIENHDGIITATGELGKGATFDVYIPISEKIISN
jgi:light-regulated signal transduction histidine kinase (bacteriophytochrome)